MKCNLRIVDGGTQLEIQPESDVEVLALSLWSEKFFETSAKANGAYLVVLAHTPAIATAGAKVGCTCEFYDADMLTFDPTCPKHGNADKT